MTGQTTRSRISTLDKPAQPAPKDLDGTFYNSDTIAQVLREIGLKHVALCPGSSFRGLHESLVNALGNRDPEIILCLHEEHAVAIAHGFARVTGEPMGVIVHSNVGLMHATMAVYNAWCDRMPVLILGGIGPMDSARRRTPIDWLHSVTDQGALVRQYVKWDDQPLSPRAAIESILRGNQIARTAPKGPVYITLDQRLQEDSAPFPNADKPDARRFHAPTSPAPDPALIREAAGLLIQAEFPVMLAGRVSRDERAWAERVGLAEALGATVLTDLKVAAAFPTDHVLHGAEPAIAFTPDDGVEILRRADVILSLDWWDPATLFKQAWGEINTPAKVIRCSLDTYIHRGWTRDHMGLAPVDVDILSEPDSVVPALMAEIERSADDAFRRRAAARFEARRRARRPPTPVRPLDGGPDAIGLWDIGATLRDVLEGKAYCLMRAPLGWHVDALPIRHPLEYLGADGAAGIGGAPGMSVGSAIALRGTGRIPVAVFGDGDYLMGVSALWTAASTQTPMLVLIANNGGYYIDEQHQAMTSATRGRSAETAHVGQRIAEPEIDLLAMARAQGFDVCGPIARRGELRDAIAAGAQAVGSGARVLIDVRIRPDYEGYPR
ncbi:MAG: thiamine pyrophosphate-dependent enzyme [Betaproteobacteria bacterium]|jgi:thiamine pyrophosphate-dependent acetolactate synthase large subunit-like protein|nr:thiamine pyrophosphate-dependent enzyme [Betaproteobacteria bacterium]